MDEEITLISSLYSSREMEGDSTFISWDNSSFLQSFKHLSCPTSWHSKQSDHVWSSCWTLCSSAMHTFGIHLCEATTHIDVWLTASSRAYTPAHTFENLYESKHITQHASLLHWLKKLQSPLMLPSLNISCKPCIPRKVDNVYSSWWHYIQPCVHSRTFQIFIQTECLL